VLPFTHVLPGIEHRVLKYKPGMVVGHSSLSFSYIPMWLPYGSLYHLAARCNRELGVAAKTGRWSKVSDLFWSVLQGNPTTLSGVSAPRMLWRIAGLQDSLALPFSGAQSEMLAGWLITYVSCCP
jgi:hypothetical protein